MNAFSFYLWYYLFGDSMDENEKIILLLGIVIIFILIFNVFNFFKKNSSMINIKKSKQEFEAIVIDKRHFTENNRNLFYVKFRFLDKEEEFLVNQYLYDSINIDQKGILTLKYDYFEDFK